MDWGEVIGQAAIAAVSSEGKYLFTSRTTVAKRHDVPSMSDHRLLLVIRIVFKKKSLITTFASENACFR